MSRLLVGLILATLASWPLFARAESVTERFTAARLQFEYKNFGNAINMLYDLLYPGVQLSREEDIVKAREMLGLAYFYTGEKDKARTEFTEVLYLRPMHRLDAFLIPPPAVQFYDAIWKDPSMKDKLEQIERERKAAAEAARKEKEPPTVVRRIYLERSTEEHWRFLSFLPFGIGQFQNGHTGKGIALAVSCGVLLATNIVTGSLVNWALPSDNQTLNADKHEYGDPNLAYGLQITQATSLGLFAAVWIYGIIDANVYYEQQIVPPFERVREEVENPKKSATDSPILLPTALPGGAGLGVEFRF